MSLTQDESSSDVGVFFSSSPPCFSSSTLTSFFSSSSSSYSLTLSTSLLLLTVSRLLSKQKVSSTLHLCFPASQPNVLESPSLFWTDRSSPLSSQSLSSTVPSQRSVSVASRSTSSSSLVRCKAWQSSDSVPFASVPDFLFSLRNGLVRR